MYGFRILAKTAVAFHKLNVYNHVSQRHIKRYIAPTLKELTRRKRKFVDPIPRPRNEYLEWNRPAELYAFNARLTEKFDMNLLEQAFTCKNYIRREEDKQKEVGITNPKIVMLDNWDLINEGEKIVSLTIENYLSKALPLVPQECIQDLKKYLISNEILAKTSSHIGTKDLILSTEYPITDETLASTFYALVAALNRSVNLEHASIFIRDILIAQLVQKDLTEIFSPKNPVDILNNILERERREEVEPRIIGETGVTTLLPVYNIAVYSNKEFLGSGCGETPEEGVHMAALNALYKMFGLLDSSNPLRCDLKIDDSGSKNLPLSEWRVIN